MHDGNRGDRTKTGLIAGLFVAILFVIIFAWPACLTQREIQNDASRSATHYSESAKKNVAAKCFNLAGQARADCAQPIEDAAREAQRGEYDLAAQQTMAVWTAVMGGVAVFGVALSAVGVGLVWTTFEATRKANKIAMDTFELASRPWLIPRIEGDYLRLNKVNFEAQVGTVRYIYAQVWIENYGDMPATIIKSETFILGGDPLPDLPTELFHVLTKGGKFYINQTQGRWAEVADKHRSVLDPLPFGTFIVPNDSVMGWLHDPPKIVCRIEYLDPAGNTRELGFAFRPSTVWTNDFKRWGEKKYNYDRKLRAPEDK